MPISFSSSLHCFAFALSRCSMTCNKTDGWHITALPVVSGHVGYLLSHRLFIETSCQQVVINPAPNPARPTVPLKSL